ncbi:hypothetical protein Hdeb2414_s0010g00340851 [Helianthus debilis subsp. tardiflorus]
MSRRNDGDGVGSTARVVSNGDLYFFPASNPNFSLFNGDEVKSQAQEATNTLFEGRLKEEESVTDPIVRT